MPIKQLTVNPSITFLNTVDEFAEDTLVACGIKRIIVEGFFGERIGERKAALKQPLTALLQ